MHYFFEFCNEMLCVADSRGYFTRVNQAWTRTLGWSSEEMTSRPFIDFVHPDDVAVTIREAELLHSGTHETILFDNRYRCRDGSYRWLSWQAKLAPDSKELIATARDVTTLKLQTEALRQAEQAAKDSEARLLLALEAGRLGIWSWDLATNRVHSSETQALIHGRSADQTETEIGSEGNIHPDDREIVRTAIERAIANEAADRITYRVVWPDGSIHWIEAVGRVFCNKSGKPNHVMGVCTDITERKRAEEALRTSEERFRQLAMHAPVGIAQSDAEGRTFFVNPKWCELAGAGPEESMDYGWQKFLHPVDRQQLIESWQADMAAGKMHSTTEYRFIRKDGSIRWVSSTASQLHDANGIPIGQIGVTVDVTERRMAEIALKEAEERFRVLATKAPVGIFQADALGRGTFVNQCWCKISGLTADETLGEGWKQAVHPDDRSRVEDDWTACVQEGREWNVGFRVVNVDGSIRWVWGKSAAVRDSQGRILSHIGTIMDVTEQKTAEDKLRAREAQLSGVLENTPAVIYLKDSDGRYLLTNRRFQDLFQNFGESVVGKTDRDFFPETIARIFRESDAKVWQEQRPLDFEEVAAHVDGLHTYRSIKFPVRDETGKMVALGGISTDISDLKAAHESLKTEQELLRNLIEVQEKEKQFLCHEFHDGLIQYSFGSAMLLESCRTNPLAPDNASKIDTVITNLRRGVEDGRRVIRGIRPAVLDDSGLEAAMEDLVGQYETSGIHVTCKCGQKIGRLPEAIQTTVYRVVQESLNNAAKHSGTDVVRIELEKTNDDLLLEIRDFGCGFDVPAARKKSFGLLGMTERVRLLGGECLIESQHDIGTTISVRLPIPGGR
jgi:PAS domain S-box-containing protein